MRRGFQEPDGPDRELGPLLDAYQIDRILLFDPDMERTSRAYRCLRRDSEHWQLLAMEGQAVLFGRRSSPDAPSPWKALDPRRLAYHPAQDRRIPLSPPRPPQPPGLFDPFFRVRNDRSPDREEAGLWLIEFDLRAERMGADLQAQWLVAQAMGLLGSGSGSESAATASALAVRLFLTPLLPNFSPAPDPGQAPQLGLPAAEQLGGRFLASRDRGPPEALLLAVRAARRALFANPDDAGAFLLLGEAYLRLEGQTREQGWGTAFPPLAATRQAQALTALEQAAALDPNLDQAHRLLAQLYFVAGQMDRVLDHLRARLRIASQEAAAGGPTAAAAAQRLRALRDGAERVEKQVQRAEKTYDANSADKADPSKVLERARLTSRHGLARKALDMLLESQPAIFGKAGVQMQLDLMMEAGRAYDVRGWLDSDYEKVLGFELYHSLLARADAACGDLAGAGAELEMLSGKLRTVAISPQRTAPVRAAVALRIGNAILTRPVVGAGPPGLAAWLFQQSDAVRPLKSMTGLLGQEADLRVLRGVLALEAGNAEAARVHFGAALDVWGSGSRAATGAGVDFAGRPIAQSALRLLEGKGP